MNINTISTPVAEPEVSGSFVSSQHSVKNIPSPGKAQESQAAAAKDPKEDQKIEKTREMADALNEMMDDLGTNLGFNIHEGKNHQVVIEVKNRKTDELIRQIPSEELLVIRDKMEDLSGLLFDRQI